MIALRRVRAGNLGDRKSVGEGVTGIRLHFGPGYRIYLGRHGERLVILLGGGTKKGQARDIRAAQRLWKRYKETKRSTERWR